MKFSDLRIGGKLAVIFSIVLALTTALGLLALSRMAGIQDSTREIATIWLPSVQALSGLRNEVANYRRAENQHVLSFDDAGMDETDRWLASVKERIARAQADYEPLISDETERREYDALKQAMDAYLASTARLATLSRGGEATFAQAKAYLFGPSRQAYTQVGERIERLITLNAEGAKTAYAQADASYASARVVVIGLLIAVVTLAAALATWVTRGITRPLGAAIDAAGRIAEGDLTATFTVTGRDETAQLLGTLGRMTDSLREVIGAVRANAEGVASAAQQIADGNADLSSRTEQQAASLEETASSMEEVTSAVRQNADNAAQGNQLARESSRVAAAGGEVVGQVVATMREIDASARRIAAINDVIDGIAFQTNILALNAAVEAARAGEAGRGFAVVAGEVRSLAQRSTEAAREIKTLINESVERVQAGSGLADRAGDSMNEVVASIRRVTDLMGEITAASQEQSHGIGQVNDAVAQMDQVTQQNAALVEQSAAAAANLREQSQSLVQAVSVFRLGDARGERHAAVGR